MTLVIGRYGPDWKPGILIDHLGDVLATQDVRLVVPANGLRQYVVLPDGEAIPVVCAEIIEIRTEDGPATGRCGIPLAAGASTCAGHAWVHEMSDAEWAYQERQGAFG